MLHRMLFEIVADDERRREVWVFAKSVELLMYWEERLSGAYFDATDYLNAPNNPVVVYPITYKPSTGLFLRDNYWISASAIPKSSPVMAVDSQVMEEYLPAVAGDNIETSEVAFKNVQLLYGLNQQEWMEKWSQHNGLRIVGAYAEEEEKEDENDAR